MRYRFIILILGILSMAASVRAQTDSLVETEQQFIRRLLKAVVEQNDVPGFGISAFTKDSILACEVYGVRRMGYKDSLTLNDYFHLGSNSMTVTSYLTALLVQKNKIHWSNGFFERFPKRLKKADKGFRYINLADLLSHDAGIEPFTSEQEYAVLGPVKGKPEKIRQQMANYLLSRPFIPIPESTGFTFSLGGYVLAAMMLEQATGIPFEKLVVSELAALNLRVKIGWPTTNDAAQPVGHLDKSMDENVLIPSPPVSPYIFNAGLTPAIHLSMPLPDYTRLVQSELQGIEGFSNEINSGEHYFMHYGREKYSMGWSNAKLQNLTISYHDGNGSTFFSHAIIFKEWGIGFVIVTNSAGTATLEAFKQIQAGLAMRYGITTS